MDIIRSLQKVETMAKWQTKPKTGKFIAIALLAEMFIIYASVLVKVVDISPIMLAFYRIAFAIPVFFILAWRQPDFKKINKKDFSLMLIAGVLFALDLTFFNLSLRETSVAHVNLIGSLVCFVLAPIGVIFFNEKIRKGFIIGCLLAILGVFLLIRGRIDGSVATLWGNFLAFICMLFYSFFLAMVFHLRKKYSAFSVMAFSSVGASASLLGVALVVEGFSYPDTPSALGYLLLIVLFGQILGQGFFSYIMGKISTQASSLILLASPLIAAIMGFFILGEKLGPIEILGIFVIISGIYFAQQKSNIARARKKILKRGRKRPQHLPLEHPQDAIRPL